VSPFWQGVLATGGAVVVVVLIVWAYILLRVMFMDTSPREAWQWWREDRAARRRNRAARSPRPEKIESYGQIEAPNSVQPPVQKHPPAPPPPANANKMAMPIDPANPPSWKTYQPQVSRLAGKDRHMRACTCHPDRPLEPGQRVLWWPVPHSGGAVRVFCEEGIEVDQ
jgi:hypothetical protein